MAAMTGKHTQLEKKLTASNNKNEGIKKKQLETPPSCKRLTKSPRRGSIKPRTRTDDGRKRQAGTTQK
jgi:hypothetical protein